MRQASEPSVEEILDSIKKVIARDNRADAAVERKEREQRGIKAAEAEEDVFELDAAAELVDDEAEEAPLLPENTASSMRESLAALAMLAEPGVAPQIVRSGETSLEGMVRAMLRPMLAEWLDKNLPPIVEAMVAKEIGRITGRKG